jgi:hypothetical protein
MDKQSLNGYIQAVRDGNVSQDIELPGRREGQVACYDRLSAVDFTTGLTLLTFGFKAAAGEYLVESFITPAAGVVVSLWGRIFVDSGFIPFIRVTGGVAGDRIALFAFGYLSDKSY